MKRLMDIEVLIFFLLGVLWGAPASGQGLDLKARILMPGPLMEAHAGEESNCEACHSSFDKSAQNGLCLQCHEEVGGDLEGGSGYHGLAPEPRELECRACHQDHQGRDFDSTALDPDVFNHDQTDFPLTGSHTGGTCNDCHQKPAYRDTASTCQACHGEQDSHRGSLGEDCESCHSPEGWHTGGGFDHSLTDFPLRGEHLNVGCASCHAGERYTFTSNACSTCHGVQDTHRGAFGEHCEDCHTEDDWSDGAFDHGAKTSFPLRGAHSQQTCQGCHFGGAEAATPELECVACHGAADAHGGRHGQECGTCHDTRQWLTDKFNHSEASGWPLAGAHAELTCLQCHKGALDDPLGSECRDCHQADDVHRSEGMRDCVNCHDSEQWRPSSGFDHELSAFPLEGMHAVAQCKACHRNYRYHETESECAECHRGSDSHAGTFGAECGSCHSPNGWQLWLFDHDRQTDFSLLGAHTDLSCDSCHGNQDSERQTGSCGTCHAQDDRHRGQFGMDCANCHNSNSFGEVKWPD